MSLRIVALLRFDGKAGEAIAFYRDVLGAEVASMLTYGDMPAMPPELRDRVAHALLRVGDAQIMFNDTPASAPPQAGDAVSVCVSTPDAASAHRIFTALSVGGDPVMGPEETSFSPAFGVVRDRFGVYFTVVADAGQ